MPTGIFIAREQTSHNACIVCGAEFSYVRGRGRLRRFCSDGCKAKRAERNRRNSKAIICRECGSNYRPRQGKHGGYCSPKCYHAAEGRKRRIHASPEEAKRHHARLRRARKKAARIESFSAIEVYERDRWICGICHKKVNRRLKHPDKRSASLDHIVSLADGGSHTKENSQLAHWICNSRKTFQAYGQLHLKV